MNRFVLSFGVLFLLANAWWFRQSYLLKQAGAAAHGTVSRSYFVRRRSSISYNVDYAFDVSGRRYEGSSDVSRETFLKVRPGSSIQIRYVPASPSISETWDMSHSNTTLFLTGVIGFPISLFIVILAFRTPLSHR